MYPNPSSGSISIEWMIADAHATLLEIYSVDGRLMMAREIKGMQNSFKERVTLTDYAAGVYFVKLSHGTSVVTVPLLKN